jgi:hypothetical protein
VRHLPWNTAEFLAVFHPFTLSERRNRELQALKLEVDDAAMGRLPGGSIVEPRRNNLGKGDRNLGSIFVRDLDHRQ